MALEGQLYPIGYLPNASLPNARTVVTFTTTSLAANAEQQISVTIPDQCVLIKISTSVSSRVRAYVSNAYRSSDVGRAITVDPTGDHGVLLEVRTTSEWLDINLSPATVLYTASNTLPLLVSNLSGSNSPVTVTLTFIKI